MKKVLFLAVISIGLLGSGCKKSNEANISSSWVGVYVDKNAEANLSTTSAINNIIINQVDASTLKIQMKALETSYIYNYTTLQSVSVNGESSATIDEVQNITENTGQYHIQGKVSIKGNQVTLSAVATNMNASQEKDVKNIYFSGVRK